MSDAVLVLNAGSSSIKFGLFAGDGDSPDGQRLVLKGLLEDKGRQPHLKASGADGRTLEDRAWPQGTTPADLLGQVLDWSGHHLKTDRLVAVGHRVVHGGSTFAGPVRLDAAAIAAIDKLTPLAPLHQPRSLVPIRAIASLRPDLVQVGCFDTAFHHGLAPPVSRYAIPRRLEAEGIRKYGFHGLSYEFIAGRLATLDPTLPAKRTIVAHLGNGASLCAMQHGRSCDTTMGFTALDGLVMGTRSGALDPGIILYLQQALGFSLQAVEHLLYHESGMLGVSELSSDLRDLSASDDPRAREAIDLFTFRIARETAALANTLGGIDALVFTGGIGEHAADIRAAVCDRLSWLGVVIDREANAKPLGRISSPESPVGVWVVKTDEEITIAKHVANMLRSG